MGTRIVSPSKKKKKKEATASTAATARVESAKKPKMMKKQPEMMKTKKAKMVQMGQKPKMKAMPRPSKSAAPVTASKQYPDARCVPTQWAPPIGTPYGTATTGGYGQFPVPMANAHYAIPTGPAGPYYPY